MRESSLYIKYIAEFKKNELIKVLLENKELTFTEYKRMDIPYGHINEFAFVKLRAQIQHNIITDMDVRTEDQIDADFKVEVMNIKSKRELELTKLQKRVQDANDMIKYINEEE